jgi:hypothetical protein
MCVVNRYTKGIVGGVFKDTLVVLRKGKKGERKSWPSRSKEEPKSAFETDM